MMIMKINRRLVVTALVILLGVTLLFTFYGKQVPHQHDTVYFNDDNFSDFARNGTITQVSDTNVFIYSVIGRNTSTTGNPWNEFGVSAWIHSELNPQYIACCFLFDDGTIIQSKYTKYLYYALDVIFTIQYACPRPNSVLHPRGITLTVTNKGCSSNVLTYVRPIYPLRRSGNESIAFCAKQMFGNLSASLVITWFEYNRAMGVDKIVTFVDESFLSRDTYKVLKYYQSQKFLEILPIEFPMQDVIPREPTRRSKLVSSDEQIIVYYCQDRLAGYSFVGVIDVDEFLFPQKGRNFKELLRHLSGTYKNAAYFTFLVEYYIKNWGRQNTSEHLIPIEYIQRAAAIKDRVKNISLRDRYEPGSITIHTVQPRRGFTNVIVPTDVAVLKHYRTCRDDWKPKSDCINGNGTFQKFTDESLKTKLEQMNVKNIINLHDAIVNKIKYLNVNEIK